MFQFDLPSAILNKRAEKFDSALLITDLLLVKIELLVKILCIFWFIVFLYYVCYLRVNKDEYILFSVCFATRYIHSGEIKIFKSNERRDEAREKRSASKKRSSGVHV